MEIVRTDRTIGTTRHKHLFDMDDFIRYSTTLYIAITQKIGGNGRHNQKRKVKLTMEDYSRKSELRKEKRRGKKRTTQS